MTAFRKQLEEIDLVTDLSLGAFLGVIHTVTLWLTTDYGTMMESLMLWGDEYTWMYISVGTVDGTIILGVISATWWATFINKYYDETRSEETIEDDIHGKQ